MRGAGRLRTDHAHGRLRLIESGTEAPQDETREIIRLQLELVVVACNRGVEGQVVTYLMRQDADRRPVLSRTLFHSLHEGGVVENEPLARLFIDERLRVRCLRCGPERDAVADVTETDGQQDALELGFSLGIRLEGARDLADAAWAMKARTPPSASWSRMNCAETGGTPTRSTTDETTAVHPMRRMTATAPSLAMAAVYTDGACLPTGVKPKASTQRAPLGGCGDPDVRPRRLRTSVAN